MTSNSINSPQTIDMLKKSNIMIEAPTQKTISAQNGITISIFVSQHQQQCEAYIEQKQLCIFKLGNKLFSISSECKMDVKYLEGGIIEAIYLFASNQQIQFHSKEKGLLNRLYVKLKREVSHRGFNEFFKPLKRLGKGSFATVYLVQHKYTGEKLAAKVFSREGQKNQFMGHEALQNEIHMLKTLNQPNIIRFEGIYETENLIYLVTQYLSGGTLVDFMRNKNNLIGDFVTKIILDILKALRYLQENNIMHRDLKPQNIVMRESDQEWVLVDFGIAAYTNKKFLYDKCGTMGYMAPQIMAQNLEEVSYTSSCDIYSLGVVAYILIIGCLPFKVEMQNFFESKFIWNAFKKQQSIGLDEDILNLLKGLLQKQPSKRMTVQQALKSRFFSEPQVIENWKDFNKIKKEQLYNKVLKSKDNSL